MLIRYSAVYILWRKRMYRRRCWGLFRIKKQRKKRDATEVPGWRRRKATEIDDRQTPLARGQAYDASPRTENNKIYAIVMTLSLPLYWLSI